MEDPSPHSCKHCQRIAVKLPTASSRRKGYRICLPHTHAEAHEAAADGCPLFEKYARLTGASGVRNDKRELLRTFLQRGPNSHWGNKGLDRIRGRLPFLLTALGKHPVQIQVDARGNADIFDPGLWSIQQTRRMTVAAFADDPAASWISNRPMNRHVASEQSFRLATQWLQECHSSHVAEGTCPPQHSSFVPQRLVDIGFDGSSFHPKLVEPKQNGTSRWACLSYCWGGQQPMATTKATLTKRQHGFSFDELPKTIQDAITVTHKLSLGFVWIDSLCIVQDDPQDVAMGISKMPEIFTHGYVTVSASRASSCHEGFLRAGPSQPTVSLSCRCKRDTGTVLFIDQAADKAEYDPVHFRSWTLQERLLSPRFLDYSSSNLRWSCRTIKQSDGGFPGAPDSGHTFLYFLRSLKESISLELLSWEWARVVQEYTIRDLTYHADRLNAISAIAQEFSKYRADTYLAGLWRASLPRALLWYRMYGGAPRPAAYCAPSWSWASIEGEIGFPWQYYSREKDPNTIRIPPHSSIIITAMDGPPGPPEEIEDRAATEIVDCFVEPLFPSAPFGTVKSAYLIVKGPLKEATWAGGRSGTSEQEITFLGSSTAVAHSFSNPDTSGPIPKTVWCLQILRQKDDNGVWGLILVKDQNTSNFTRVGCFYFEKREDDAFRDADVHTIRII